MADYDVIAVALGWVERLLGGDETRGAHGVNHRQVRRVGENET